jgi:hypothetical protein
MTHAAIDAAIVSVPGHRPAFLADPDLIVLQPL